MARSHLTVDLDAIRANIDVLGRCSRPAAMCVVVKADGYGHGAVPVARAALEAGATWLAVAQVDEARALRAAAVEAPCLLLSEPGPDELDLVIALRLRPFVYRPDTIDRLAAASGRLGGPPVPVHLKVDTGMRRVGAEPDDAAAVARRIAGLDGLVLEGLVTHLARADEPDDPTTSDQLRRFEEVREALAAEGIEPAVVHAANSAGAIAHPASHYDLVRCGIAAYGITPSAALAGRVPLRPALRFTSVVTHVKRVRAGEGISYGHRFRPPHDTVVATVPTGYADGVPRVLGLRAADVLLGGRRRPIVGVVTMDQLMVDCGPEASVSVGEEVVLIGEQDGERITAEEWAVHAGTIGYEIVCGVGRRARRSVVG